MIKIKSKQICNKLTRYQKNIILLKTHMYIKNYFYKINQLLYINFLCSYFEIIKIQNFLAKKYYWPIFCHNIKTYNKDYKICLNLKKIVSYKIYNKF